jgi:hypothetical protein
MLDDQENFQFFLPIQTAEQRQIQIELMRLLLRGEFSK